MKQFVMKTFRNKNVESTQRFPIGVNGRGSGPV
jgi:hypothetical protein